MILEIKWLKTFIVAAKYENFRKTSEELFLTQPAVTKHIKRLEEELHVELFERTKKKSVLTAAGYQFLPYARSIVDKYEEGRTSLESWRQGYKRRLVIAAAPQIASSMFPSLLRTFMDENPDIDVVVQITSSFQVGEEVSLGRADLGLTRVEAMQTNIYSEVVHEEPVVLVGPYNEYCLEEHMALSTYRVITDNHPDYWDYLLRQIKSYYPNVRTMAVNQVEITKRFIEQGLGVSYLPVTMVRDEVQNSRLREIRREQVIAPKSKTYLLQKTKTEEAEVFRVFLKEVLTKF
ncbi:LysR family transcriptional regulator [Ectobacillus funiculus]|uniref:LysR family transcriptional regulator n=1 Tax=Ectobacillus funiculus TaxID=137993 RepID=UPI001FE37BF3|nr:LysR family transcriptional regulator [Ectobacillus funiculus]